MKIWIDIKKFNVIISPQIYQNLKIVNKGEEYLNKDSGLDNLFLRGGINANKPKN